MAREMKNSGIEWIGEIPINWERTKLLNLLRQSICDGPHETPNLIDVGIPFISVDSLNFSETVDLEKCKKFISEEDYLRYKRKANIEENDILFTKAATIGKTAIVGKEKFMVWSPIAIIKPNQSIVYNKYVYHLLNCHYLIKYISLLGSYNTQINVGMRELEQAIVPLPPLSEQKKIVSFLDKKCAEIEAVIEKTKTTIEEYKKLKQSVITEAVTKGIRGNRPMKDSGIEWIGEIPEEWETAIVKYSVRWKSVKGQPEATVLSLYRDYGIVPKASRDDNHNVTSLDTSTYKVVSIGDFVINKMKAWQGSMAVSNYEGIISPAYHVCEIINPNLNKKYFHHLMRNHSYVPEYTRLSTGMRIGQWDLGFDDFKNIPFIIPPMKEQKEIVEFIENGLSTYDYLIDKKTSLLTELENYKKSLIYEYVTGKKEVGEVSDNTTVAIVYPYFPAVLSTDKARFAQAVLMSKILSSNVKYLGRVKLEKMLFTIEHCLGFDFDTEYAREMAGPLDGSIYECEKIISRTNKWFYVNNPQYGTSYKPQKNMEKYKRYYEQYFSDYNEEIESIISVFENYSLQQSEIIATLFAAWNDAIIDKKQFTDEDVVNDVLNNWHESKTRFSKDVWLRAMDEMRKNNLIPKGYGKKTVTKNDTM